MRMESFKPALTDRLTAVIALCFTIAIAFFMNGSMGNVTAEEVVIEVPTALAAVTNETAPPPRVQRIDRGALDSRGCWPWWPSC